MISKYIKIEIRCSFYHETVNKSVSLTQDSKLSKFYCITVIKLSYFNNFFISTEDIIVYCLFEPENTLRNSKQNKEGLHTVRNKDDLRLRFWTLCVYYSEIKEFFKNRNINII